MRSERRAATLGSMRILIVDDSTAFRRAARAMLEMDGFADVIEAIDGEEALTKVADLDPDVILLDIQLPGIDGLEVAERLDATGHPPITLLISSRNASDYGRRLTSSPARAFLRKEELTMPTLTELVQPR